MAGLLAALFIKKQKESQDVVIMERSGVAGGLFRGVDLPGFGACDSGMRFLYETGIPDLDEMMHGILPEKEWRVFAGTARDIGGIYWRGELQTHSPYLDLRRLSEAERRACECEMRFCSQMRDPHSAPAPNAAEYLIARFGRTAGGHLIRVLEKLHRVPASTLDKFATHQLPMNRVVLFGEGRQPSMWMDEVSREVIAWPDQLLLPPRQPLASRALYPQRFGMTRVIDALVQQLRRRGVHCWFNRNVAKLEIVGNKVSAVKVDNGQTLANPRLLISATGLAGSLGMLRGTAGFVLPGTSPRRSWLIFLRVSAPPEMGKLYHFWCFDEAYRTSHVTHYSAYCPEARTDDGFPLCIELWSEDRHPAQAIARAARELRHMGILKQEVRITAQAAVQAPNLHAQCTLENARQMRAMRDEVKQRSPENMIAVGPFVEEGVMMLYEIARSMCELIASCL